VSFYFGVKLNKIFKKLKIMKKIYKILVYAFLVMGIAGVVMTLCCSIHHLWGTFLSFVIYILLKDGLKVDEE
jgi:hypothetical protein